MLAFHQTPPLFDGSAAIATDHDLSLGIGDAVARLSDEELLRLADDLDFYSFAGVPTRRMLDVLANAGELDPAWDDLRASGEAVSPAPIL